MFRQNGPADDGLVSACYGSRGCRVGRERCPYYSFDCCNRYAYILRRVPPILCWDRCGAAISIVT